MAEVTGSTSMLASDGIHRRNSLLVALPAVQDLLLSAKHLFVHLSTVVVAPARGSRMSKGTSSALNSEQDLASIPTAQGGLSRLAIARLKSAGVPVAPLS
jgi:hypothetical protein